MVPLVFYWLSRNFDQPGSLVSLKVGVFFAGLVIVGQFSFWGNYIPQAFPLHLRGTGESFAANIGGRVLGTSLAAVYFTLSAAKPPSTAKMAATAATIAAITAAVGIVLSFFLPEPDRNLSDE